MSTEDALYTDEYLRLVRWALRAGTQASDDEEFASITVQGASSNRGEFGRLVAGVLFSRRFILSYQLALLSILFLFTLLHWSSRLRSWRARNQAKWDRQCDLRTGRSSSSTTLNGVYDVTHQTNSKSDEQTRLLQGGHDSTTPRPWIICKIRACLVYQPSALPIIKKNLPSNGCSLLILAFLGLQVFYTFYNVPISVPMLFIFADRTALVFVANLPLLYLFAAKNQLLKPLTGNSYETLNIFHRRLGEYMCLLAILHSIGMLGVWYTILRPVGLNLAKFVLSKIILLGLGAFVAYEAIYLTSLASFRQRWYELFLALHVVLQTLALILVFFHHHGSRPYVVVALAIFLIDRLIYRITLKSWTTKAYLEIKEDQHTVSLYATIPVASMKGSMSCLRRPGLTAPWKATDHVFLSIPSLARKHWIQSHPFTIASRAPRGLESESQLDLIIRAQDGFSKDLVRYAKSHASTTVRLDGPYGSQSAVRMLQDTDLAVIVAGGSGIAVAWPLVWSILDSQKTVDVEPLTESARIKRVLFVWIVHQQSHLSWIGKEKMESLRDQGVEVILPPPTEIHGHPDLRTCVANWIVAHDVVSSLSARHIGIVCSGPDGMNRSVRNLAASLISKGHPISVEIEKFGW